MAVLRLSGAILLCPIMGQAELGLRQRKALLSSQANGSRNLAGLHLLVSIDEKMIKAFNVIRPSRGYSMSVTA